MYEYEDVKSRIFCPVGARQLVEIYSNIRDSPNGLITIWDAIKDQSGGSFEMLACVDFLQEIGQIKIYEGNGHTQDDVIKYLGDS